MQNSALKYKDENDRSMGLAGSAIALVIWDGEDKLAAIDLDSLPGEGMEMTPDFSFAGNPRLSARLAWQMMVKQLELTSAMVMGNVLCRSYVGQGRQPSSSARAALRAILRDEAISACSLEDDEFDQMYSRLLDLQSQIFTHNEVATMARTLAADLLSRRRLTAAEVLDRLDRLSKI